MNTMTSTESIQMVKKVNDSTKKSPLKVVSPIIKKYTGHRKGKIKNKLKFPRVLYGRSKQKPIKLQYKTILPKSNAGNVIVLEPELLPCALNLIKRKKNDEEINSETESSSDQLTDEVKHSENILGKESNDNSLKSKAIISLSEVIATTTSTFTASNINNSNNNNNNNVNSNSSSSISSSSSNNSNNNNNVNNNNNNNNISNSNIINNNKKKIKCLKNLKTSLELLDSNFYIFKERREQAFVENYLLRVQDRLKDNDKIIYNQFIDLICNFQANKVSVCDMYKKVKALFATHDDLIEDFVAFLTPEQAVECGVFMDHLLLTTMSDFLNMIDIYFAKSPHQIKKIHSVLESLASKSNLTTEYVVNTVLPLFKGNPVLNDYFIHMLPNMRPPDNFCTDFEEVEYSEINSDVSDEEDIVEIIHLPEVEDQYGSDSCPCKCHEKGLSLQSQHCVSCSLKFINGRIFIQSGKLLRPAKVVFDDNDVNYHRERLAPKLYPKKTKKRHKQSIFKDNLSPTKSCNLSSDEFKSDIEEEEKQGRPVKPSILKSSKANVKKTVSPKLCDKSVSKCIFLESKPEVSDGEEKSIFFNSSEVISIESEEEKVWNQKLFIGNDDDLQQKNTEKITQNYSSNQSPKFEASVKDAEETIFEKHLRVTNTFPLNEFEDGFAPEGLPSLEFERSHSPPVISIPENESSLLANAKPILSLLENLDESKTEPLNLVNAIKKDVECKKLNENSLNSIKKDVIDLPWKLEEDRVILQTLQVEKNCEETFMKIAKSIPNRSIEDIKMRFADLMNMLYEMKAQNR